MSPTDVNEPEFEQLVSTHYEALYRFAFSLARSEAEASDLTQQTFYRWASKGSQLRDRSKAKSWLFTTLHREFLGSHRRRTKFPHVDIDQAESELPAITPTLVNELDAAVVLEVLADVCDLYRAPLTLFYLEEHSYQEIAGILEVPIGTVMSRLSRGKGELRKRLADRYSEFSNKVVPLNAARERRAMNNG